MRKCWASQMTNPEFERLLSEVVQSVLETMFFVEPMGPAQPEKDEAVIESCVAFHGHPSGKLVVCVPLTAARPLAAAFLGEDEETLHDSQPGEVVCEFANMLCGSLVSKIESEDSFALDPPELSPVGDCTPSEEDVGSITARCSYALDPGFLMVTLYLEAGE